MRGVLLLELGGILLALAVLGRLAGRFSLSPIPAYLLVGLLVGEHGVMPLVTAGEFIELGAELGAILLLLMLGLEYSVEELLPAVRGSAKAGGVDLVLNFTPGAVLALALGWGFVPAVLLGGVTYISSSGIAAKLIADSGWSGNRETPVVLAILVIEDLVMAAYLPVAAALLVGDGPAQIALSVTVALGVVAAVLASARRFAEPLSRTIFAKTDEAILLTVLGTTMIVAGLAEQIQISAAVGAFLVGLLISGEAEQKTRALLAPIRDLFAATFFVFFGLGIDAKTLPAVVVPALILAAVGVGTKLLTAEMAGREVSLGASGRRRAGALLVSRGEFSIIIAELGVVAGLEERLGVLAAAYVMVMATMGPIAIRVLERRASRLAPAG